MKGKEEVKQSRAMLQFFRCSQHENEEQEAYNSQIITETSKITTIEEQESIEIPQQLVTEIMKLSCKITIDETPPFVPTMLVLCL